MILLAAIFAFGGSQYDIQFNSTEFNKFYYYKFYDLNFTDADNLCKEIDSKLVQPRSRAEVDLIDKYVYPSKSFFIGAKSAHQVTPSTFMDGSKIEWFDWMIGQEPGTHVYDCTIVIINEQNSNPDLNRKWLTKDCSLRTSVVCEQDMSSKRLDQSPRHTVGIVLGIIGLVLVTFGVVSIIRVQLSGSRLSYAT